jgi:hypothetical protein
MPEGSELVMGHGGQLSDMSLLRLLEVLVLAVAAGFFFFLLSEELFGEGFLEGFCSGEEEELFALTGETVRELSSGIVWCFMAAKTAAVSRTF